VNVGTGDRFVLDDGIEAVAKDVGVEDDDVNEVGVDDDDEEDEVLEVVGRGVQVVVE